VVLPGRADWSYSACVTPQSVTIRGLLAGFLAAPLEEGAGGILALADEKGCGRVELGRLLGGGLLFHMDGNLSDS